MGGPLACELREGLTTPHRIRPVLRNVTQGLGIGRVIWNRCKVQVTKFVVRRN